MNNERFKGKNVFITGAGSGFGRATALKFAEQGAENLYLVDLMPYRIVQVEAEV
jgi:NAD(P)-dependent dehydrogenase (short-subunit alcohol dehydrogenase family)